MRCTIFATQTLRNKESFAAIRLVDEVITPSVLVAVATAPTIPQVAVGTLLYLLAMRLLLMVYESRLIDWKRREGEREHGYLFSFSS